MRILNLSKQHRISIQGIVDRYQTKTIPLPTLPELLNSSKKLNGKRAAIIGTPHVYSSRFNCMQEINNLYLKGEPCTSQIIFFDAICAYHRGDYVMSMLYSGFS